MKYVDIVRAWKDPLYRQSLTPEELATLPVHPSGMIELTDQELSDASGGTITFLPTFNLTCGGSECCPNSCDTICGS